MHMETVDTYMQSVIEHVHVRVQMNGHVYGFFHCTLSLSQILTTHAMEEVDHLCTRIGIRNFGRLCCLGTQNRLKSKINSRKAVQQFETYRNKFFADIYRFVVVIVTY